MFSAPVSENQMYRTFKLDSSSDDSILEKFKNCDVIWAFSGGGTDGLGSLEIIRILDELVKRKSTGKVKLLDILWRDETIVAGTSTGSIITALVKNRNRINPDTGYEYTIKDFQNMYRTISPKIFTPSLRWLIGCFVSPFSRQQLDRVSHKYLNYQVVSETPGLVIMALNKSTNVSELIAQYGMHESYTLGEAAEASSAIPCAFAPKIIESPNGEINSYSDGGSCIVNLHPTIEALRYYKLMRKKVPEKYNSDSVLVVDIGAGNSDTCKCLDCINPINCGGLCNSIFDGTINEVCQHLQRSGPEIVQEMADEEVFDIKVFQFDFPMQYPLAFTEKCLNSTVKAAHDSVYGDPQLELLADLLVERFS